MSFVLEAVGTFLFSRGYYPLIEQKRRKTGPYCFLYSMRARRFYDRSKKSCGNT